jgi:hypothetical protein
MVGCKPIQDLLLLASTLVTSKTQDAHELPMHGERRSVEGREYQNERDLTDVDDFKSGKI